MKIKIFEITTYSSYRSFWLFLESLNSFSRHGEYIHRSIAYQRCLSLQTKMRTLICQVDFILHMNHLRGGHPILRLTWKQTNFIQVQKHDLQMFSLRSCHVIRVRAPIHQHRTSRIPCSICQVSPCRRYSSTSRCKARLSGTVSGGYLAGIIWTVILATWMTWQAIHPFFNTAIHTQIYDIYVYIHSDIHVSWTISIMTPTWWEIQHGGTNLGYKRKRLAWVAAQECLVLHLLPSQFLICIIHPSLVQNTCAPHLAASKPEASVRKRSAWTVQLCRIARPSFELPMKAANQVHLMAAPTARHTILTITHWVLQRSATWPVGRTVKALSLGFLSDSSSSTTFNMV